MQITGFANGAFDALHDGHRHFLRSCVLNCDKLIVALNTDASVQARKGPGRPLVPLLERVRAISACLRENDQVVSFNKEGELFQLMVEIRPDILFKGEDWCGKAVTAPVGQRIQWIARHPGYSTTVLNP